MPAQLRTFSLRKKHSFYTTPHVADYTTTTTASSQLVNFKNRFNSVHEPVFINGSRAYFTQDRDFFYSLYPETAFVKPTGLVGNGTPGVFAGTILPAPVAKNTVSFSCVSTTDTAIVVKDVPDGDHITTGTLYTTGENPMQAGTINYITGEFTFFFLLPTKVGEPIYERHHAYLASVPTTVLYYGNTFSLRPIPDNVYKIEFEVTARPTELIQDNSVPELEQWWQWIAFEASKKVFEDRLDQESLAVVAVLAREQELYAFRSSIMQAANEKMQSVYRSPLTRRFPF